jgi:tetratricopeptide (TPR) repeat protein
MASAALLVAAAPLAARAQNMSASQRVVARQQSETPLAPTQKTPPATQTERERRAQAYAKLLEGQRYYTGARTGALSVDSLQRAQQAFRQAATLDPTLAEARTALAEIAFFLLGDQAQAESEAAAALKINKDNFGALRVLSRVYTLKSNLAEGKPDATFAEKAVTALREVIRVKPNDPEAWALLGEFHLLAGREKEALEAVRKWVTLPASIEGRFFQIVTKGRELTPDAANARLAELLLRMGQTGEAIAAIRRAMSIAPENPAYLAMLGEALDAAGTVDESILNELRRIVAQEPKNTAAVGVLARAEARAGRHGEAIAGLRAAIAARAGNEREQFNLRLQLAEMLAEAGRFDEAVNFYEDLLKERNIGSAPPSSDRDRQFASAILRSIINIQHQAGQEDKALATIERLRVALGGGDPATEALLVTLTRSIGKRQEALVSVRDARKRYPDDARLLNLEAITLSEAGRVDEALQLMRGQLKGAPGDYDAYVIIASLLMNAGRGNEAVVAARKALELAPATEPVQNTNALLLLSSAQERAGDAKGSEETLRRILAKDPDNATALNNLGYFLTERDERLPEALEMIQRAVRTQPANPSFLDSLGWVYFKLGKLPEAERYLRDAARRNPASSAIQEHLGDLLLRLGRKEQARAAWQKALSLSVETADSSRLKAKLSGETSK